MYEKEIEKKDRTKYKEMKKMGIERSKNIQSAKNQQNNLYLIHVQYISVSLESRFHSRGI